MKKNSNGCYYYFIFIFLLLSCNSENPDIERGHRYFNRGNYIKAIQNYSFAIKENPLDADALFYRGLAEIYNGDINMAIDDFTGAINIDQNHTNAYINRGTIWKEKGEFDKALLDYNRAISLNPRKFELYSSRAEIWLTVGCFEKAIFDYTIALSNNQISEENLVKRAEAYYNIFDYVNSIKDCKLAIEINSKYSFAYNNLAWIYSTCTDKNFRDGKVALEIAKIAVELDPIIENKHTLAAAYAENRMFDKAITTMKELLSENGANNDVFKNHINLFMNNIPLRELPGSRNEIRDNKSTELCK